jgi:nitrate/TMAO reductase-like tetraheme cytochrome c subunit
VKRRAVALAAFLAPAALAGAPRDFGVPDPRGWLGTTNQWIQGVGLVFAALNLILIVVLWRMVRRRGVTAASKAMLLGAIVVLPVVVLFLATAHGMSESMKTEACGACHVMDGHFTDLRNPKSESLAAVHYKNRYIQENHCYTCHSDYGFTGTLGAKFAGLGHTYRNLTGQYELPLKVRVPYSNLRCLSCHGGAQNFLAKHDKDEIPKLMAGQDSCLDCHGPAHTPEKAEAPPEKQAMK